METGRFGRELYMVINKRSVMVYNFKQDTVEEYSFSDKVKDGIYEDLEIDFSGIRIEQD